MPCATLPIGLPVKEDRHVKETKDNEKHGHFVDAGRAESEIFESDPEVAEVFESDKHGHGARSGGQQMMRELRRSQSDRRFRASECSWLYK